MRVFILIFSLICFLNCQGQNQKTTKETHATGIDNSIFQTLKGVLKEQSKEMKIEEFDDVNSISLNLSMDGTPYGGYYFSKKKEDQIMGDLNADGTEDIIVSVESNSGGNSTYTNYYLFLSNKGKFELVNPNSWDIPHHCAKEPYGSFYLKEIKDGKLIGESWCLTEEDPRCCPSMIYTTIFELKAGKPVWKSTEFKQKKTIEDYQGS